MREGSFCLSSISGDDMGIIWGGFHKLAAVFSGVPIARILVYWGLYYGP